MRDSLPSRTALATAFARALHVHIDERPPVLDDQVALQLLPGYQQRFIRRLAALSPRWLVRYRRRNDAFTSMRAQVVVRARFAEDVLAETRRTSAVRYVILAAGLDTFAFRQGEPVIDVLEIDHPATQHWKRDLLGEKGLVVPPSTTLLPIDFERETLDDIWVSHAGPDVISWLGATYYLSRDAILATLTVLADRVAPGSSVVLDYWSAPPPVDPSSALFWGTRLAVALQQEPMISFFTPAQIEAIAREAGWQVAGNLDARAQYTRYLEDRADRLSVPSFAHLLHLRC